MSEQTKTLTRHGAPCWLDVLTGDVGRSNEFYSGLFGWTADEGSPEFNGYFMYSLDGAPIAGGMPNSPGGGSADRWGIHFATDDAAATSDAVVGAGGTARTGVMDIGTLGSNAMFTDAAGSTFGIWKAKDFAGSARMAAVGAPCWFELRTDNYDAAIDFYASVFGLQASSMSDDPQHKYTTLGIDGAPLAGIMDTHVSPGAAPAGWHVYFGVSDTDAALDRVRELGGSVTRDAEDGPFGREADLADPGGVAFSIVSVDGEGGCA